MWPTPEIFEVHRYHGLSSETCKRIGVYTFQFHEDGSGVTIQRNIWGRIEATWIIAQPDFGSVEEAVKNHWSLLNRMVVNAFDDCNQELQRLVHENNHP
ncbi:hypothetical protein KDW_31360 [Dictyobacter vulcani]|uniref:Uncharacterized protein n=1 Tax=Dictyobacter vulcani TaxID=2607529 RepID=A0A5J4KHN0_9CHLR|nr:hypothetical protein [Dictyobacter vulcani]GER88974.1 hypothetical protein KDW_31360 [Dictyobacter vulcani]